MWRWLGKQVYSAFGLVTLGMIVLIGGWLWAGSCIVKIVPQIHDSRMGLFLQNQALQLSQSALPENKPLSSEKSGLLEDNFNLLMIEQASQEGVRPIRKDPFAPLTPPTATHTTVSTSTTQPEPKPQQPTAKVQAPR